jgi:hypothetical protein
MYCRTCRGPVQAGFARCYQCDLAHQRCGALLADVVAPVAYAVKGGRLAGDLWRYKSGSAGAAEAGARLTAMLARFLREHGDQVWRAAGMTAGPGLTAVVPSGQGRPGPHPLLGIVTSCVDVPIVPLAVAPGAVARARGLTDGVAASWLTVGAPVALQAGAPAPAPMDMPGTAPVGMPAAALAGFPPGLADAGQITRTDVLLVDDTWVSGSSAQTAVAALKAAGARRVALVVLGRHVDPADPRSAEFLRRLRAQSA